LKLRQGRPGREIGWRGKWVTVARISRTRGVIAAGTGLSRDRKGGGEARTGWGGGGGGGGGCGWGRGKHPRVGCGYQYKRWRASVSIREAPVMKKKAEVYQQSEGEKKDAI